MLAPCALAASWVHLPLCIVAAQQCEARPYVQPPEMTPYVYRLPWPLLHDPSCLASLGCTRSYVKGLHEANELQAAMGVWQTV